MKKNYVKDITLDDLAKGDLSEFTFLANDGSIAEGVMVVSLNIGEYNFHKFNFENGKLTNIRRDGKISPAVEGPGYVQFRTNGILTNPDSDTPAVFSEGFNKREYWENGKCVRVSEKSYDADDNPIWS